MSNLVSINNGFHGDGTFTVYLSPSDWGQDFERDLQDAGVECGHILEHSETARDIVVLAVAFTGSGGVRQLARLLDTFLHRHDGKEFMVRNQVGDEITTAGFGVRDVEKLLRAQLEDQRKADDRWNEFTRRETSDDNAADPHRHPDD